MSWQGLFCESNHQNDETLRQHAVEVCAAIVVYRGAGWQDRGMRIKGMHSLKKIFNSTKYILSYALPIALFLSALKIIFFQFSWDIISLSLIPFIASILTGIIFLLGIMLAGVLTDYKESEKIPSELANSLSTIWQEACIQKENLAKSNQNNACIFLQKKLYDFVDKFKSDFLTGRSDAIKDLVNIVDSFSDDFLRMDNAGVPATFTSRIRNEQANIRRLLFRIEAIRDSSFLPSLLHVVEVVIVLFTIVMLFLKIDPMINGVILLFFYGFLLTSILLVLEDLDNPFGYGSKSKIRSDEIDFKTLFDRLEKSFVVDYS